jgi:hypothetical protein
MEISRRSLTQSAKLGSTGQEQPNGGKCEQRSKRDTKQVRSRHHKATTHEEHLAGENKNDKSGGPVDHDGQGPGD